MPGQIQRGREVADDNIGWKVDAVLACPALAHTDKPVFHADVMEVLEQADHGRVERLPDVDTAPPLTAAPAGTGAPVTADGLAPGGSSVSVTREAPKGLGPPPMDELWDAVKAGGGEPDVPGAAPPPGVSYGIPPNAGTAYR